MIRTTNYVYISLLVALMLLGCSPDYHIHKAEKHTEKAIKLGATFKPDTIHDRDTTIVSYYKHDTLYVEKTIRVAVPGEIRYITKKDKRKERKAEKVEARREHALNKIDLRQSGKTNRAEIRASKRSLFGWGVLVGVIGCIVVYVLYRLIKSKGIPI